MQWAGSIEAIHWAMGSSGADCGQGSIPGGLPPLMSSPVSPPVKEMQLAEGCVVKKSPISEPLPVMTFNTPLDNTNAGNYGQAVWTAGSH